MAKEGKKITDYCDYVNTLDNTPYDVDKDYVYGKYQFSDEEIDYYDKIDLKIKNYSNSEKFKNEINKCKHTETSFRKGIFISLYQLSY